MNRSDALFFLPLNLNHPLQGPECEELHFLFKVFNVICPDTNKKITLIDVICHLAVMEI